MDIGLTDYIVAVVTTEKDKVGGGAPIFYAASKEEMSRLTLYLAKMTKGMVHDLENGVCVIVRH